MAVLYKTSCQSARSRRTVYVSEGKGTWIFSSSIGLLLRIGFCLPFKVTLGVDLWGLLGGTLQADSVTEFLVVLGSLWQQEGEPEIALRSCPLSHNVVFC